MYRLETVDFGPALTTQSEPQGFHSEAFGRGVTKGKIRWRFAAQLKKNERPTCCWKIAVLYSPNNKRHTARDMTSVYRVSYLHIPRTSLHTITLTLISPTTWESSRNVQWICTWGESVDFNHRIYRSWANKMVEIHMASKPNPTAWEFSPKFLGTNT